MRYIRQHIQTIIDTYDGNIPLAHFLKNYFKRYPILGGRDRKMLGALAYSWYRSSKGIDSKEWLNDLMAQWLNEPVKFKGFSLDHWIREQSFPFYAKALFPFETPLSAGIDKDEWMSSMLVQPDLFIRVKGDRKKIFSLLNDQNIPFTLINDNCFAFPNGAKIDTILPADTYAVQDASSQQTGTYFNPKKNEQWYDCCSGAGGKSLLLKDIEPGVHLTVSDERASVIHNLRKRFRQYHHELPVAHVADITNSTQLDKALGKQKFDNIICDAPCSGSGTWARTPEQMYFFDPGSLDGFSGTQKAIAINVARYLKPGGRLIYITCSVFKQENEAVVEVIGTRSGLEVEQQHLINGLGIKADSMFVAVLA